MVPALLNRGNLRAVVPPHGQLFGIGSVRGGFASIRQRRSHCGERGSASVSQGPVNREVVMMGYGGALRLFGRGALSHADCPSRSDAQESPRWGL